MPNLIPDAMRTEIRSALSDVHETMMREITVFFTKTTTYVATQSTYHALYARLKDQKRGLETVTEQTINARVHYISDQNREMLLDSDLNLSLPNGSVRLKVDADGHDALLRTSRVEIDGEPFELESEGGKTGPFEVQYYVMYFKRKV